MRDLTRLPKAHLHVHLESTIRWETLREIGDAHGVEVPARRDGFAGFRDFGDHGSLVRGCLRAANDFRRVAAEFCADEAAQGVRYAEVTFTAASHGDRLGDPEMPLEAVLDGLADGAAEHGIECRVLLDHSRRRSAERARRTLDLAIRYAGRGVIGIGMAGDESYPLAPFAEVFDAARHHGMRLVHHAGEMCGPGSIREALTLGRAERIGHGIRLLEDRELLAEVRDRGVPLEVCPSSNVALGLVPSFAAHPLDRLRAAGVTVTLNTDIPAMAATTLTEEYTRVRAAFGYDDPTLAALAHASAGASFAASPVKARLHRDIDSWLASP